MDDIKEYDKLLNFPSIW